MFRLLALIDKKKANNIEEFNKIDIFAFKIKVLKKTNSLNKFLKKKKNLIAQTIFDKTIFFYVCLIEISVNFKKQLFDVYIKFVK